jgi:hypothetical protein
MTDEQFIRDVWASSFAPPDRRPIWEWAHEKITELPAVYGDRRAFSVAASRHFVAPFEALQSTRVHEIGVLAPVRSGKTLIADVSIPWFVSEQGASVLWILQSDPIAKSHAETRLWPILEHSPCALLLPADRHKQRTQEVIWTNGQPLFIKGPSPSNLQSRGFRVVVLDECWMYDKGVMGQAKARLGDFVRLGNQKFICISQGGSQGTDWQEHTETARRYEWEVACLGCGQYFEPRWSGFREDGSRWGLVYETVKDASGDVDREHAASTAAMECPHCKHRHKYSAALIGAWNASGRYVWTDGKDRKEWDVKTAPDRVLFHWEAVIDYPWRDLVHEWIEARKAQAMGNYEKLKTFIQKRCADHDNPNGKNPHALVHEFKRYDPAENADGFVIASIDKQARHDWMMVAKISRKGGEVRRLWYGKCNEDGDVDRVLEQFKPNMIGVDVNYDKHKDNSVFRFALNRRAVGLVGSKDRAFPHYVKRVSGETDTIWKSYSEAVQIDAYEGMHDAPTRNRYCLRIKFASDTTATRLHRMIEKGLWLEPSSGESVADRREYDKQMSAEHRETDTDASGRSVEKWVAHSKNNHAWDCAKMILALATIVADSNSAPIEF